MRFFPGVLLAALTGLGPCAWAQTTIATTTYTSGQTLTVSDPISISAGPSVVASSGSAITFSATTSITLLPGFDAVPGSFFHAVLAYTPPGSLMSTSDTDTTDSFSWTASTDGSEAVNGYQIYRNGVLIATTGSGVLTYTDTGLSSDTTYVYSVDAVDLFGDPSPVSTLSITTTDYDPWLLQYFGTTSVNVSQDYDGNGYTVAQDFTNGYNPVDITNGRPFVIAEGPFSNTYTYDLSGRLSAVSYANGVNLSFVYDAQGNISSVTNTGPIVAWRTAQGLPPDGTGSGADTATPANDGVPNLVKYALGLTPSVAVTGYVPLVTLTQTGGQGYLTITYTSPSPAPTDITYVVQVSSDGINWASGSSATTTLSSTVSGSVTTTVVSDLTPVNSTTFGRQIRLAIERNPIP